MKTITVRYLGQTNTQPNRVKAFVTQDPTQQVTVCRDTSLNYEDQARIVVLELLKTKLEYWPKGTLQGGHMGGDDIVFAYLDESMQVVYR